MTAGKQYDAYAEVADLYDYVASYRTRSDVQFFVDAAKESGGPVLEIGCGTGRVLIPTARAGIEMVGLDFSPHMLGICRDKLRQEPEAVQSRVQLVEADMRDFELGRTFKTVTMPFRPFQLLTSVDDQLACLAAIRRHLVAEGQLVFDVFNPSLEILANEDMPGQEFGEDPAVTAADGRKIVQRARFAGRDRFNQINDVELIYYVTYPDGRQDRLVHAFPMRYLFRFEVEHLLARSGFDVEHLYADYSKAPYGSKYPGELIFVARKAAAQRREG